mmetsp:Transcript_22084/g.50472  ORF Transcript_22084/g.50472 Transcript_22084/m.50472 type:complete len:387 (-) Transcript_22084:384-1544(-)
MKLPLVAIKAASFLAAVFSCTACMIPIAKFAFVINHAIDIRKDALKSSFMPSLVGREPSQPRSIIAGSSVLRMSAAKVPSAESKVFILGLGFSQFLLAKYLATHVPGGGLPSVVMSDISRAEGVRNWLASEVSSGAATIVTNGEGEWEAEAANCTSIVVCPEAADIPGRTILALLQKMPRVKRVVVVNPAGTTTGETMKVEGNWLFNKIMMAGGKRVGEAGDNMEFAKSCEEAVASATEKELIDDYVIIHRGKLNGGGLDNGYGLGDDYYKICGSVPEEVLCKSYDCGRVATVVAAGDVMDVSLKKRIDKKDYATEEEADEASFWEEIRDKTHRLALASAVTAALTVERPPSRFTVLCGRAEVPESLGNVQSKLLELVGSKEKKSD